MRSLDASLPFTTRLSSAGLVYFHFGRDILRLRLPGVAAPLVEAIFAKLYRDFVEEIDANDNGISVNDAPMR